MERLNSLILECHSQALNMMDPIGDLQTMAKMLSVIRPGGLFFIGIPSMGGKDILIWNAHRGYGQIRLPHMFAGWHFIDIIHGKGTNKPIDNNTLGCCDQHLYRILKAFACYATKCKWV
jgi:hypothetical protein